MLGQIWLENCAWIHRGNIETDWQDVYYLLRIKKAGLNYLSYKTIGKPVIFNLLIRNVNHFTGTFSIANSDSHSLLRAIGVDTSASKQILR